MRKKDDAMRKIIIGRQGLIPMFRRSEAGFMAFNRDSMAKRAGIAATAAQAEANGINATDADINCIIFPPTLIIIIHCA